VNDSKLNRRQLARELTAASRASAAEILRRSSLEASTSAHRIGFTGPPGGGKSTLIAALASARARTASRIGVLAIDPTSPISGGSILGDRIRMDEIADCSEVYIRSMPSRWAQDGLTGNVVEMLRIMDRHHFDEVFLETVGVGQTDHAVKAIVDTVVLVLVPESGDSVQAMKAGILEMADIYVVNKSDRPNAQRIAAEIESVLALSTNNREGWKPPILMASAAKGDLGGLGESLDRHRDWVSEHQDPQMQRRRLARQQLQSVINQHVAEIADGAPGDLFDSSTSNIYSYFVKHLRG
jgi:LAO/AO transport system kinase